MWRNTAGLGVWRTTGILTGCQECLTTTPNWSLQTPTSSPQEYPLIQTTSETNPVYSCVGLQRNCSGTSSRRERRFSLELRGRTSSGRSCWELRTTRLDLTRLELWDWWTRMSTRPAFPFTRVATTETALRGRRVTGGGVQVSDNLELTRGFFFQLLYLQWAKWTNFYKRQPLWLVKRYFGDKVSLVSLII